MRQSTYIQDLGVALGLSLLLHATLAALWGHEFRFFRNAARTPPSPSVEVEFIDSPERVAPAEEDDERKYLLSDRETRAQDAIPDHPEEADQPRMDGTAEIKSIRKVPRGAAEPRTEQPEGERGKDEEVRQEEGPLTAQAGSRERDRSTAPSLSGNGLPLPLDGPDEFLSPEAYSPEGKALILKQAAYNTRSDAVGRYLARVKPRIANFWTLVVMNNAFYIRARRTSILFKIMPDGALGEIMVNEHDGPAWEVRYALRAVQGAAPFEPLDREILDYIREDGLWIEFEFIY